MTESGVFQTKARQECMEELNVEEFEVVETLNNLTCPICAEMDGKHFRMTEFEIGVTAPLFHPNCRGCTAPYFSDNMGERVARDEEGEIYYVSGNMTYKEWKNTFVKTETELTGNISSSKIKAEGDDVSLEYQRYGRNKQTVINHTYINSGEYRNRFDRITDNISINRILYNKAKEMLNHRSGTKIEDMYWIDRNTGNIVASVTNQTDDILERVEYPKSVKDAIRGKDNLIAMHTHPQSLPPSAADFNSAYHNGYTIAVVICHDGTVIQYTSKEEISEILYSRYIQRYIMDGCTEYEAQWKALEKLKENHDIDFWEVKP